MSKVFFLCVFIFSISFGMKKEEDSFTYRNISFDENIVMANVLKAVRSDNATIYIVKNLSDGVFHGDVAGEKVSQEELSSVYTQLVEQFKERQKLAKY